MPVGTGYGVDLSGLNDAIIMANNNFKILSTTGVSTAKAIDNAFKQASNGGIMTMSNSLEALKNAFRGDSVSSTIRSIGQAASASASPLQKLSSLIENINNGGQNYADLMSKINQSGSNSFSNNTIVQLNAEIESAIARLGVLKERLNFYATGEGAKAAGVTFDTTAYQEEANALMKKIELLTREREHAQGNARVKAEAANQQQQIDNAWYAMERARRAEMEETSRAARRSSEEYVRAFEDQQRAYERLFQQSQGRTPEDLLGLKGVHKTLADLQRYAGELQKTMSNLDPKSKEWRDLNVVFQETQKKINNINKEMLGFDQSAKNLTNSTSALKRILSGLFSIQKLHGYSKAIIDLVGHFEQMQLALGIIVGNQEDANRIWQQTIDLAVKSPFQVKQLVQYTRQLAAYRIETEKLHSTTRMLADVSAGLGVDMNRLILAYGQVRAAEYLRGTELRQFTEAGVPMLDELAKHFTELNGRAYSTAEIFDMISKRMVAFEDVNAVLERMTSDGGVFYKMQEQMSTTIKGMRSNLRDEIDLMMYDIGQSTEGWIKGFYSVARTLVKNWESVAVVLKAVLGLFAGYQIAATIAAKNSGLLARNIALVEAGMASSVVPTNMLTGAFVKLGVAWNRLNFAFLSSPIGIAIAGISALIAVVGVLANKSRKAAEEEKKRAKELKDEINSITRVYEGMEEAVSGILETLGDTSISASDAEVELEKLINIAEKEYHMVIDVQVKGKSAEEIKAEAEKIASELKLLATDAESLEKDWEENWQKKQLDFVEYTYNAAKNFVVPSTAGAYNIYAKASVSTDEVKKNFDDAQREVLAYYEDNKNELLKEVKSLDDSVVKTLEIEGVSTAKDLAQHIAKLSPIEAMKLIFKVVPIEGEKVGRKGIRDAITIIEGVYDDLTKYLVGYDFLSDNKVNAIQLFLNKMVERKEITPEQATMLKSRIESQLGDSIDIAKEELVGWQKRFNDFVDKLEPADFGDLSAKFRAKEIGTLWEDGVFIDKLKVGNKKTIDALEKEYKTLLDSEKKIIDAYEREGESIYTKEDYLLAKKKYEQYFEVWTFLGGEEKNKGKTKTALKILQDRISLIKKMHKQYIDEYKTFGAKAKGIVSEAYEETFNKAFEGTGINFAGGLIIDQNKLKQLQREGDSAGQVFSEAMIKKMNEVAKSGTYIRGLNDAFDEVKEKLKIDEGFVPYIYSDTDKKKVKTQIKDVEELYKFFDKETGEKIKGTGTLTIGYGHSLQTLQEAKEYLKITLSQSDAEKLLIKDMKSREGALNNLLDEHKELIVTQEQYNQLFNNLYQGGLKKALNLAAGDISKTKEYIAQLDADLQKMGSSFAQEFGGDWLERYEKLPSIAERFAMQLQIAALTTKDMNSHIDPTLFGGMKNRSAERYAAYRGDLEVVKVLQNAVVDISQVDFTNIEGVLRIFEQMRPLAEKEGKEAVLELDKVISEYKAKVGLEIKKNEDKKIVDQVQDIFNRYDMTVKLKKMDVSPDFAKNMFDIDFISFEDYKKGVIDTFTESKPYVEEMSMLASEMGAKFKGNVDLLNRKMIPAIELAKKGWKDAGEGFATVFSSEWGIVDDKDQERKILVTPILPDGTVLSEDELGKYIDEKLNGAEDILKADTLGVVIAVDVEEGAGDALHKMQEDYYNFVKLTEKEQQELVKELNKEVKDIDWTKVGDILGPEQAKEIKKRLEDIAKTEDALQIERVEKYLKYTRAAIGKRAKIKLEELRKLSEIEETFKPEALKKEHDIEKAKEEGATDEQIKILEEENRLIREGNKEIEKRNAYRKTQKELAAKAVRDESKQELQELDWEEYQKSDTFVSLFEDLDNASDTLLKNAIDKLKDFKEQWKDMPLEDMNKIVEKIDELESKLAEAAPWEAAKRAKQEIKDAMDNIKFEDEEAAKTAAKGGKRNFFTALDMEDKATEEKVSVAEDEVMYLEAALRIKQGTATVDDQALANEEKIKTLTSLTEQELEGQLKTQKGIVTNGKKSLATNQQVRNSAKNLNKSWEAQAEVLDECIGMANDLYGAVKGLLEALDEDDPALVFAEVGMNILSSIPQMLTLIAQIRAATLAANGLGSAMNMAMGIIGLIVMAIQLITQAISAVVNYADKMKQMKLDVLAGQVDHLKQKYDELAESIEEAWSYKQLEEYSKELDKVQKKMVSTQKQYVQLLRSGKDSEKTIATAEAAQAKLDAGLSVDSLSKKEKKALLSEEYEAYKDATEALLEMEEDYAEQKKELLEELGGVTDPKEAAEEFVDAWLEAYKETGDGLSGLDEKFDEFFENLIKKKAAMLVAEKALTGWVDAVNNALDTEGAGGADITSEEQEAINKAAEDAKEKANKILLGIFEGMDFRDAEGEGLSGLQKGIQGITEDQADILAAYWNSVRGYTASIDAKFDALLASMGVSLENPQLIEMRNQSVILGEINLKMEAMNATIAGLVDASGKLKVNASTQLDQLIKPRANGGVGLNIVND